MIRQTCASCYYRWTCTKGADVAKAACYLYRLDPDKRQEANGNE